MRACFVDNADLPITCSIDDNEQYNCQIAMNGMKRDNCPHWQPQRAVNLVKDILVGYNTKPCFGEPCKNCDVFFSCSEHWGEHYICAD